MSTTKNVRAYYSPVGRIRMLGGDRALDLANTIHWRDDREVDFVPDYEALVNWSGPALLLSKAEAEASLETASRDPVMACNIHAQWLGLRGELKSWLAGVAPAREQAPAGAIAGAALRDALIAAVNAALAGAVPFQEFSAVATAPHRDLIALPLRRSAAAVMMLLMFPPEGVVRQCQADRCGGFFLDRSRSRPRRWCAMESCGNRMKAAAFRRRKKI